MIHMTYFEATFTVVIFALLIWWFIYSYNFSKGVKPDQVRKIIKEEQLKTVVCNRETGYKNSEFHGYLNAITSNNADLNFIEGDRYVVAIKTKHFPENDPDAYEYSKVKAIDVTETSVWLLDIDTSDYMKRYPKNGRYIQIVERIFDENSISNEEQG